VSKLLIFAFIFILPEAFAAPRWTAGLGFEARLQRQVNPDFVESKILPQIFARLSWTNWEAELEGAVESSTSASGALKINSHSQQVSGWARYAFLEQKRWRPFVDTGVGCYFDQVKSEFSGTSNEASGFRPFFGAGGGIFSVFWNHLLVEAEGRLTMVRERKEPLLAALVRIGYAF